ncbi:hypothetical protein L1286_00325 [Pseudoalteromonas sp. SMS1]|uniref:hypothetical protein n=1 Tax=Pseudoalteromonas sp. SMS1 TaxID=2908894 RepID=UPI001F18D167|nr:hypothetical protein [Pseudoalteromonas sp. SMS1]MCF2855900.1 hypothetical protein [Pseudoalteromonas sp. SMS1]
MKLLFIPIVMLLASCSTTQIDWDWEPNETGCQNKALFWPSIAYYSEMPVSSVRFGYQPDNGKGPAFLVTISSGMDLISHKGEPYFLVAYGDNEKSCVIKMSINECSGAKKLLATLSRAQIPLVHAFDNPEGVVVLHGTRYYLSSKDGQNNFNAWSFYGYGHPMIELIKQSKRKIEHCTSKALTMYKDFSVN